MTSKSPKKAIFSFPPGPGCFSALKHTHSSCLQVNIHNHNKNTYLISVATAKIAEIFFVRIYWKVSRSRADKTSSHPSTILDTDKSARKQKRGQSEEGKGLRLEKLSNFYQIVGQKMLKICRAMLEAPMITLSAVMSVNSCAFINL